ncbi:FGGY family carbohydrate kinase [Dongia deserti]|uniref:FGGY family carbohydrate kinase n=1 Tax=Dongia deserti TaxID=2268030 RepID=UPI000E6502C7|nr:FGGY family carbohydrate kinase [Dongia deserti]
MPPEASVIAIDQGTTGTKAHRLRSDGTFETIAAFEHRQIYPRQGWVEHDPEEIARHVEAALDQAGDAGAIGIANQGETVIAWDAATKRPIHNAIVWQDARTSDVTERTKSEGAETLTLQVAGLPLDPYYSATKLRWLLDNVPEAQELRRAGRLRLGTSDAFFLDRFTGRFATDVTTASRTSLMNLETLQWDERLADLFGVPIECLPEIRPTAGVFGDARGIPVAASLVDQQAALFGHGCRRKGDAKITFGTGAFALAVADAAVPRDTESGLEATIAWKIGDAPCAYALQGGIYNAASAVNWARNLGLFADYKEIDDFAAEPAIARGLVFVPALSGLSCPYWDRRAAGLWLGMGLDTTRADMMQALLEGIALLSERVLAAIDRLSPLGGTISVDGGLTRNRYFNRFLADAAGKRVRVPASTELTGLGAAQFAAIGAGLATIDTLPAAPPPRSEIEPGLLPDQARARFERAVERAKAWR